MPLHVHLPIFSCVGFTMNQTNFGVVTPKFHGSTVKLHNSTYVATSLEHVIRFLDKLQSLVDGQCLNEVLQELSLEEEEVEPEPPEQLMQLTGRLLNKLMVNVERKLDERLSAVEKRLDERLSAIERKTLRADGVAGSMNLGFKHEVTEHTHTHTPLLVATPLHFRRLLWNMYSRSNSLFLLFYV